MFRNAESHFANVPNVEIPRSKMKIPHNHTTTFNVGQIIPIYYDGDILPGDSVKMQTSKVVRLQTLLTPMFGNMYLDTYWFFVPYRLVWKHWKEFMLENTSSPWAQTTQYAIPTISAPSGGFAVGSLADYIGYPTGVSWSNTDKNAPSALPFRIYAKCVDEFFRDENVTYPLNIPDGDTNQTGTNGTNYINDVANGGAPFMASRFHDYFSSCLPSAQKAAQPVTLPVANGGMAPVGTYKDRVVPGTPTGFNQYPVITHDSGTNYRKLTHTTSSPFPVQAGSQDTFGNLNVVTSPQTVNEIHFANLWADLSNSIGAVTVNELRLAFQLQRFYERLARGGSRYTETIRAFFGVTSPDSRLQRPEYLGGNRVPIQITEVTNTAQSTGESLGDLGAKSNTSDVNYDFDHSFTEHGALICLAVVRFNNSFSQGFEKQFLRKTFTDFYWPTFAHLGEMPVKSCQIYADGNMNNDNIFGYQEAWAEYRYKPDRISGEMRPGIANSLAAWHLGDFYTSTPTLSDTWMREPYTNVDRVLAVTSAVSNQCLGDFAFLGEYTRPMPVYSVPGLIDHF